MLKTTLESSREVLKKKKKKIEPKHVLATPTLSGHIFREKKILQKHMYSPRLMGTIR